MSAHRSTPTAQGTPRDVAVEVPVAMVFDGSSMAVMLASPTDIEDFALGFALTEGIIQSQADVDRFEVIEQSNGLEARFWLKDVPGQALANRRRAIAGPIGCGLCGIDSLDQAARALPNLNKVQISLPRACITQASTALRGFQPLHDRTHAAHAAGFMTPNGQITAAREDVGRHNALDKLIGALLRQGIDPATGAIVMTSRLSLELVQKAAMAGCPVLIAVSSPTALAIEAAQNAGITLVANARNSGFDLFTHPQRIGA